MSAMRISAGDIPAPGKPAGPLLLLTGLLAIVVLALSVAWSTAQEAAPPKPPSPPLGSSVGEGPAAETGVPAYRLAPGDVIDVKFFYSPELNESLTIRPDGLVSLQLVGEVQSAGLTPAELTAALRQAYAKVIRVPEVTVIVKEFAAPRIYVGGEVMSPGTLPLRGQVTLAQAVVDRGGAKHSARLDEVLLLRHLGTDAASVSKVDLKAVLKGQAPDVVLRPYDVVFVAQSTIARIGTFVDQYINAIVPKALSFPYNLNTKYTIAPP